MSEIKIITVKQGKDGRLYPPQMLPPRAWRWQVVTLTHELAHGRGLSERATQAELLARGYRRSLGTVHNDLTRAMPGCLACQVAGEHWRRATAEAGQRPAEPSPEPAPGPGPSPAGDGGQQQQGPAAELAAWLAAHRGREQPEPGD